MLSMQIEIVSRSRAVEGHKRHAGAWRGRYSPGANFHFSLVLFHFSLFLSIILFLSLLLLPLLLLLMLPLLLVFFFSGVTAIVAQRPAVGQKTLLAKSQNTNGFLNYPRGRQLVGVDGGGERERRRTARKGLKHFRLFRCADFRALHVASCTLHVSLCFARCIELSAAIRLQLV